MSNKNETTFTIGADPEIFVTADGQSISAHDLVPGTKEKPHKVSGGAIQVDGLALEFNVDPVPSDDYNAFEKGILDVMTNLHTAVKTANPKAGFAVGTSAVTFPKDYYDQLPDNAKELGCDPDYCAYDSGDLVPNPRPEGDSGDRGAGGHIHIGWGSDIPCDHPQHVDICRSLIRNLDAFVGLGMLVFDHDTNRRKVYGKAGAFRPKSYGVEYRTPSNAWIWTKANRRFIHRLVSDALKDMMKGPGNCAADRMKDAGHDVQSIINNSDADRAVTLLKEFCNVTVNPEHLAHYGQA